jgi:biopolymer transport protein ExbB
MESLNKIYEYFQQGGWVMFPLGLGSLVMWALILDRLFAFRKLWYDDIPLSEAIGAVQRGKLETPKNGLRARLVRSFLSERSGDPQLDVRILRQSTMRQQPELSRYLAMIAVLASIAPLMGLLGTVLGMIETFDVISLFGTGNAKALAGGISVALVTTQTGLLVAIPGLFLSGVLWRRSSRLSTQLEETATTLSRVIRQSAEA